MMRLMNKEVEILKLKRFMMCSAAVFGSGILLFASGAEARRAYEPEVATQVTADSQGEHSSIEKRRSRRQEKPVQENVLPSLQERIDLILNPPAPVQPVQENDLSAELSIEGIPLARPAQCVSFLLKNNPHPSISVTAEQLVAHYYEEGEREGIRPDMAFAQAIKETGYFRYGGTVLPEQNNYCGLGTTSAYVQGGYFATAQLGVRAQIQHLMAYCTTRLPQSVIVDPRYWLVRERFGDNVLTKWTDLNGRWAVPGPDYGESIMYILSQILLEK